MDLYLLRHGQALNKAEDPEEGLSPAGERMAAAAGKALAAWGAQPDLVAASPKKRAMQSAALAAGVLGYPAERIITTEALKPLTPPQETWEFVANLSNARSVLLAGHLPSMGLLAAYLLGSDRQDLTVFEPATLCLIHLERPEPGRGRLMLHLPYTLNAGLEV